MSRKAFIVSIEPLYNDLTKRVNSQRTDSMRLRDIIPVSLHNKSRRAIFIIPMLMALPAVPPVGAGLAAPSDFV